MARRRSSRSHVRPSRVRRDALDIARPGLHDPFDLTWVSGPVPYSEAPLSDFEDRRLFSPYTPYNEPGPRRFDSFGPGRALVVPDPAARPRGRPGPGKRHPLLVPRTVAFERPEGVVLCEKRQRRKEVLHASGKAGSRVSKPTYGFWSQVSCKKRR